jgi:1-phosphofructokinase
MIVTVTLNPSLDERVCLRTLRLGELNRASCFERYPGGKGINVARVAHELRAKTLAVAIAGGSDGDILSRLLDERRIAQQFIHVKGSTRNNYQLDCEEPKQLTQINTPGPTVPASALAKVSRMLVGFGSRASAVVLSGSLPPGAPAATYASLIRRLSRLNIPTVLDSSGEALRQGLLAKPWLIKPNRQEAEELLGRPLSSSAEVIDAARHLAATQASIVVISLGPDGAVLATRTDTVIAETPKIKVGSTVGAGDSLGAGFLIAWFKTKSLIEAFRLGVACGTATAMTSGTELCRREDVLRLLPRILIRPLGSSSG